MRLAVLYVPPGRPQSAYSGHTALSRIGERPARDCCGLSEYTQENIVDRLLEIVPEFAAAVDEHRRDYDGMLPHVLFGDLTRFVLAAFADQKADLLRRCLTFLDDAMCHGDDYVQNLVALSFVENVPPWDRSQATFIDTWPAAIRAEALRQRDWRPNRS